MRSGRRSPRRPTRAVRPAGSTLRPRRPGHQSPLRRGQRLLRAGPRTELDVLVRRFVTPTTTLEEAQAAKHELVCRKLGLVDRPRSPPAGRGCGWGSMAIHAAQHHGAQVVGIALSHEQVDKAKSVSAPPDSRTRSRSASRTTATCGASGSTPSRRSECSSTWGGPDRPVLRHAARSARPDRTPAQPRHLVSRRIAARAPHLHRPIRLSRRRAASMSARSCWPWSGPASRCGTSSRSASTTRRRCMLGGQPRDPLGRSGVSGRPGAGRYLASLHGRLGRRIRRRRHRHPPGARCRSRRRRFERDAPHRRVGLRPTRPGVPGGMLTQRTVSSRR